MSFELERCEAMQVLEGLENAVAPAIRDVRPPFTLRVNRPRAELKQSLEIYAGNGSPEPLTLDTYYAPLAIYAIRSLMRAQLPPFSGHDIPPEYQAAVDTADKTVAKIAASLPAKPGGSG